MLTNAALFQVDILELVAVWLLLDGKTSIVWETMLWPRFTLFPLVLVCRSWNAVFEKHLYRTIELGDAPPKWDLDWEASDGYGGEDIATHNTDIVTVVEVINRWIARRKIFVVKEEKLRKPVRVALDVWKQLSNDAVKAHLVSRLSLKVGTAGIGLVETRLYISIVDRCHNIRHLGIWNMHGSELDHLANILKTKRSLTSIDISLAETGDSVRTSLWELLRLLEVCSGLKSLFAKGFCGESALEDRVSIHARCCPHLQEVRIPHGAMNPYQLEALYAMSSRALTTLDVPKSCLRTDPAVDGLCVALHGWSETIEHLKIAIGLGNIDDRTAQRLNQALQELTNLKELSCPAHVALDSLCYLPKLEHLSFNIGTMQPDFEEAFLASINDGNKFRCLKRVFVCTHVETEVGKQIARKCISRGIELHVNGFFL